MIFERFKNRHTPVMAAGAESPPEEEEEEEEEEVDEEEEEEFEEFEEFEDKANAWASAGGAYVARSPMLFGSFARR